MIRKISAKSWGLLSGALFVLTAAGATLPMRLVLDGAELGAAGLSARSVSGSIWHGRLMDVHLAGLPMGDMAASVAPLSLLSGDRMVQFRRLSSADRPLVGTIYGGGAMGFSNVSGVISLPMRFGPLALADMQLSDASLRFDEQGRCAAAGGTAHITLSAPMAGLSLRQGLSGPISCAQGSAHIALTSQSGMEKFSVTWGADGAWRARFAVAGVDDPALQAGLLEMGFQPVGDGYALAASGR